MHLERYEVLPTPDTPHSTSKVLYRIMRIERSDHNRRELKNFSQRNIKQIPGELHSISIVYNKALKSLNHMPHPKVYRDMKRPSNQIPGRSQKGCVHTALHQYPPSALQKLFI